ncbi:hypothetical protein A1O1_03449, partial [Capronia coronata CBS 617.96]
MCKCAIILTRLVCAKCNHANEQTPQREVAIDKSCKVHHDMRLPTTKEHRTKYVEDRDCKRCRDRAQATTRMKSAMASGGPRAYEQYVQMPVRSHTNGFYGPPPGYQQSRRGAVSGPSGADAPRSQRPDIARTGRSQAVSGSRHATAVPPSRRLEVAR